MSYWGSLSGKARVRGGAGAAFAICDVCGTLRNHGDLKEQYIWAGPKCISTGSLVCFDTCFDTPNPQFKTIYIPPDPRPIPNARPFNFDAANKGSSAGGGGTSPPVGPTTAILSESGATLMAEDGSTVIVLEQPVPVPPTKAILDETGNIVLTESGGTIVPE